MKATKVILPIAIVLIALIAIFFLAPLKAWRKWNKEMEEKYSNMQTLLPVTETKRSYTRFCCDWWKDKFTGTIDGGWIPEITVTANK